MPAEAGNRRRDRPQGSHGGRRPGILAKRPAPVQPNYLGFPGTLGRDFIDYMVADRLFRLTSNPDWRKWSTFRLFSGERLAADYRGARQNGPKGLASKALSSAASTTATRSRRPVSRSGCGSACGGGERAVAGGGERGDGGNLKREAAGARGGAWADGVGAPAGVDKHLRGPRWPISSSTRYPSTPGARQATRCGRGCRC